MKRSVPALPRPDNIKRDDAAVSPVIGAILLILLTVLFAGITASSVYGKDYASSIGPAPMAVIEIESVTGGVPNKVQYEENYIVLMHKGGDPLQTELTRIIVTGEGSSHTGIVGYGGKIQYGDLSIIYDDLTHKDKKTHFASNNVDTSDGVWSSGELLIINGDDSPVDGVPSSVHVTVKGMTNTSNNYGLKHNSIITVKVFDQNTNRIIAQIKHKVTPAE